MTTAKQKIEILYDGDCPFCSRYVEWLRLKDNFDVVLNDARKDSPLKIKATALRLNLDNGMVVELSSQIYHGAEAMTLLTVLSTRSGLFNGFMAWLFAHPKRARVFYPIFAFGRGLVVTALGRGRIGNLK